MGQIFYSLLRVLQLQQQKHNLDLQQPVPGSRQRPRTWSTILLGSGIFLIVFGIVCSALQIVPLGGFLLISGTVVFVAGLVLMVVEVIRDLPR